MEREILDSNRIKEEKTMSLTQTPRANQLHIGLFGKRNSGKSSLINALTNQETALVSSFAGTTTDPVYKTMEIHGIGPCVFIDTPGFDDVGELGIMRVEQTKKASEKTDIAIIVCSSLDFSQEMDWAKTLKSQNTPYLIVVNKADLIEDTKLLEQAIIDQWKEKPILVSAKEKMGMEKIREAIIQSLPDDYEQPSITGDLVKEGDLVLLVMPQDIQAPKGRLILPQVQTMRELLDKKCIVLSCTTDKLEDTLNVMVHPPKLIITDSQVFATVFAMKPLKSLLTSFSVLFAAYKGDMGYFVEGAKAVSKLKPNSKVLIAEACTHAPLSEDIGRVKLPKMLRKTYGETLEIIMVAGSDFPEDLGEYDLIIHCGACMFNRKHVLSRVEKAKAQGVPMSNYGVVLAYLTGILDKIDY